MGKTINESMTKKQTPFISIFVATLLLISAVLVVGLRVMSDKRISADSWENYAATSYSGGNGSLEDPYIIASAEELALLAKETNEGKSTKGIYYLLSKDISLEAHPWMPIGIENAFEGVFSGEGHAISKLYLEAKEGVRNYGLFGNVSGIVCNLELTDATASILYMTNRKNWQPEGQIYVSLLCGQLSGEIYGVNINGSMDTQESENMVLGMAVAAAKDALVDFVTIRGDITVYNDSKATVAGFSGVVSGNSEISNISYKGDINYSDNSSNIDSDFAGLIADCSRWSKVKLVNSQAVAVFDFPKGAEINCYGLCNKLKKLNSEDFLFCSFSKSYIKGSSKEYLPSFDETLIGEDIEIRETALKDAEEFSKGIVACGYFISDKKFTVYGGEKKEIKTTNCKKYFKRTLGYDYTGSWSSGSSNYPVVKTDLKNYCPITALKDLAIYFYSDNKGYVYSFGRRSFYDGFIEQDGEHWYVQAGRVDFKTEGTIEFEGKQYQVKDGKCTNWQ